MTTSRGDFIRKMGTGLASSRTSASTLANATHKDGQESLPPGNSERLLHQDLDHVKPAPVGYDRLPLVWDQMRTRPLKERLANLRAEGI